MVLERPKLNQLRELVRTRRVDVVVVYCLDRLSGDPTHGVILTEELEKCGVLLETVTEDTDNSDLGKLITYIRGYAAKVEVEKIRERTMRGKAKRIEKGKLPTGRGVLYGYDYDKERGLNTANADLETVQMIGQWLLKEHLFLNEVCRRLMERRILAPKGGRKWSRGTISRMMRNPAYAGRSYAGKTKTQGSRRIRCPEAEQILVPDAVDQPAFTWEQWELIQRQLDRNREVSPRNQKLTYLLRGFLYCQDCGRKYHGVPMHGKPYYRCSGRSSVLNFGQRCNTGLLKADQIEAQVWGFIMRNVFDPEEWIRTNSDQSGEDLQLTAWKEELERTHRRLDLLDKAETRLLRVYEVTEMSDAKLKDEHARIHDEAVRERQEASRLENQIKNYEETTLTEEQIRALAVLLKKVMDEAFYMEETEVFHYGHKRLLLEVLGLKVHIDRESVSIDIKLPSRPPREYSGTVLQQL